MGSLDRSLTIAFGAVVLALMVLFLLVASVLSFHIQDSRQTFLASALAQSVEETVNRVNFYQMRVLVVDLKANIPGIGYIAVVDLHGRVLAHSEPELNGLTLEEAGLTQGSSPNCLWQGVPHLQVSLPLRGGLDKGTVGSILVGVSVADLRRDQAGYIGALSFLCLVGTALAMGVVFILSRRFGGRTQILALQLQGFLDRAPVGMAVVDGDGRFVQVSRSLGALVSGQDARFPTDLSRHLDPAQAELLEAQTDEVRTLGTEATAELTIGAETWHVAQFPLGQGQTGLIAQDLSRRVLTEKELIASRAQLNQIIERSPVGIAVVDLGSSLILRTNRRFVDTYGWTIADCPTLTAWNLAAYPDPDYRADVSGRWATATARSLETGIEIPSQEADITCKEGHVRTALVSTAIVGTLAVVTFVDRTEQKRAEDALSELNHSLEEKVRSRTEELQRTYRELLDTEKLAALGQLAAGMAHELNTPLGAIQAANRVSHDYLGDRLGGFIDFVAGLSDEDKRLLVDLEGRTRELALSIPPAPDRPRRRALLAALEARGWEADDETAEYLLELGWTEANLDLLAGRPQAWRAVVASRNLLILRRMNKVVADGAEKAAHVVDALRRYLKGKDESESTRFLLAEQVETILTLFQHQLKHGVEIHRSYTPGAAVVGDRQRLNQVWMNLIHNALQAMDYQGILRISIVTEDRSVRIEVGDSGPGVAPEIRDKIFTPYFTTKAKGEGMGLGLDLCRKIVEAHQGTITFESRPGDTVFTVALPAS